MLLIAQTTDLFSEEIYHKSSLYMQFYLVILIKVHTKELLSITITDNTFRPL
jgi:hypothetical protein